MVCQDAKVVQFFADFCNFSGQLWYLFFSGKRAIIINKKHRNKTKKNEEEKSMRLWKKVSAMVAMAAMCMTLAVPVTASAAEVDARMGGCPGGCQNWTYGEAEEVASTEPHEHIYISDIGVAIHLECKVKTIREFEYKACKDCGTVVRIRTIREYTIHSVDE